MDKEQNFEGVKGFSLGSFAVSWEQRKLCELLTKARRKNGGLRIYETITNSVEYGIISQRDYFDHDIAKIGV